MRYRDGATGRFIPHRQVFQELNKVIQVSERRMVALSERYQRSEISLKDFKLLMREEVKSLHIATAVVSNGGINQMDSRRWGEVGARLKREFQHLNDFGSDLARGRLRRESGKVRNRARSYGAQARMHYWETTIKRFQESGLVVLGRRRTGPVATEHCSGCKAAAGDVWLPLNKIEPIGSKECLWFCHCWIEFKIVRAA